MTALLVRDPRSEEHTSELQSRPHLVCRLLLEKKKNDKIPKNPSSDQFTAIRYSTQHTFQYETFAEIDRSNVFFFFFFFFNDTATTEIYTLSLHDALPI